MAWCFCDESPKRKDCKNRRKLVVMPENSSCYNPYHISNETNNKLEWQLMELKVIKFKEKQSNSKEWIDVVYRGHKVIYEKKLHEKWFNLHKSISL